MRVDASQVGYTVQRMYSEMRQQSDQIHVDMPRAAPQQSTAVDSIVLSDPGADVSLTLATLVVEIILHGRLTRASSIASRPSSSPAATPAAAPATPLPQWSISLTHREAYEEKESLNVNARGTVRTADGTEIRFNAEFKLARSFVIENSLNFRAGNANLTDPLFLETSLGLSLLVCDRNGDGAVSSQTELFGATSGNGFTELAAVDQDRNGWIDSADPVFGELRLVLENGSLASLASLGIGALSTSSAEGAFQYKDSSNQLQAVVRRTGICLSEDGQAWAIRQIDLADIAGRHRLTTPQVMDLP